MYYNLIQPVWYNFVQQNVNPVNKTKIAAAVVFLRMISLITNLLLFFNPKKHKVNIKTSTVTVFNTQQTQLPANTIMFTAFNIVFIRISIVLFVLDFFLQALPMGWGKTTIIRSISVHKHTKT